MEVIFFHFFIFAAKRNLPKKELHIKIQIINNNREQERKKERYKVSDRHRGREKERELKK